MLQQAVLAQARRLFVEFESLQQLLVVSGENIAVSTHRQCTIAHLQQYCRTVSVLVEITDQLGACMLTIVVNTRLQVASFN